MAKGKDMVSKDKTFDDKFNLITTEHGYAINQKGINMLLDDYWNILEKGTYSYDPSVIFLRADYERALRSSLLSPLGRVSLSLVYGMQLTLVQVSKLIKVKVSEIKNEIEESKEILEAVMNGYRAEIVPKRKSKATNLNEWMDEIRTGAVLMYDIPNKVNTSFLQYLAENRDTLAKETLRQKVEGMPKEIHDEIFGNQEYNHENYPFHDTAESIENPMRKWEFRTGEYDYFRKHDAYYSVAISDDLSKLSKGLHSVGRRTVTNVLEDRKNSNGKGLVFKLW